MENVIKQQQEICKKFNVVWTPADDNLMVGLGKGFDAGAMPINGLRHPITPTTTGWYIWAGGEIPQDDSEFFSPHHTSHLEKIFPIVLKYLGLPPGWWFQIDDKGYEDVWEDKKLLDV